MGPRRDQAPHTVWEGSCLLGLLSPHGHDAYVGCSFASSKNRSPSRSPPEQASTSNKATKQAYASCLKDCQDSTRSGLRASASDSKGKRTEVGGSTQGLNHTSIFYLLPVDFVCQKLPRDRLALLLQSCPKVLFCAAPGEDRQHCLPLHRPSLPLDFSRWTKCCHNQAGLGRWRQPDATCL